MASTFSSNLRLELIGAGEQAGTWGTTTNTNLGTLLDQAIAGATTVAVVLSSQAFSVSNGGADEARNASIKLTTSTGAAFSVYAPPVAKQYVVYNASSYTATIYNSTVSGNTTAAGTGVAIPAGETISVWSDGTNMAQQNTALVSPHLSGTPTAPTAGAGTNTTQIATTAFVTTAVAAAQAFPSGTVVVFGQTSAPTGWTKITSYNNAALRVVSGSASSGGSVDFTTAFASQSVSGTVGSTTLTESQIPSHAHQVTRTGRGTSTAQAGLFSSFQTTYSSTGAIAFGTSSGTLDAGSDYTGGGGSHNHSFSGTAINLAVKYVDAILASKD